MQSRRTQKKNRRDIPHSAGHRSGCKPGDDGPGARQIEPPDLAPYFHAEYTGLLTRYAGFAPGRGVNFMARPLSTSAV